MQNLASRTKKMILVEARTGIQCNHSVNSLFFHQCEDKMLLNSKTDKIVLLLSIVPQKVKVKVATS